MNLSTNRSFSPPLLFGEKGFFNSIFIDQALEGIPFLHEKLFKKAIS